MPNLRCHGIAHPTAAGFGDKAAGLAGLHASGFLALAGLALSPTQAPP